MQRVAHVVVRDTGDRPQPHALERPAGAAVVLEHEPHTFKIGHAAIIGETPDGRTKPRETAHNWRKMMRVNTDTRTHQWLTVSEAALVARVSSSTIRRWVREGALPVLQPCEHGAVRISAKALEAHDGR